MFGIVRICRSIFKRSYLENENIFLNFLFVLLNLHQILYIFRKKKVVIANVLLKLETVRDLVRALSKNRCLRASFESQHVKVSQKLPKSELEHFYHIF